MVPLSISRPVENRLVDNDETGIKAGKSDDDERVLVARRRARGKRMPSSHKLAANSIREEERYFYQCRASNVMTCRYEG